jgi:TolB protein
MKIKVMQLFFAVIIFFATIFPLPLFASQWMEYRITTSPADQKNPDIDGNIVAWEDSRNSNIDIYAADIADLNNPISFRVSSHSLDELSPQVSGRKIFYTRREPISGDYNYEIYMYNIDTGSTFLIADDFACTVTGADESTLVWSTRPDASWLYAYDIATQSVFPVGQIHASSADVSGNIIVWRHYTSKFQLTNPISGFDMSSWETFPIETDTLNSHPAISNNIVVWEKSSDIYGADISDTHNVIKFSICTEPNSQYTPTIGGYNVVWVDSRNGNQDIFGYNLSTQTEFVVTDNSASQTFLAISENIVVWQDNRHGHYDIYATVLYGPDVPQCLSTPRGDLNGDCKVDFQDLAIFTQSWLECNLDPPEACFQ